MCGAVDYHNRRKPACTEAAHGLKAETPVRTGGSDIKIQSCPDPVQYLTYATDIAGSAHTNLYCVPALGNHCKKRVKCDNTVYVAGRYIHAFAYIFLQLHREVAKHTLATGQHRDEASRFIF